MENNIQKVLNERNSTQTELGRVTGFKREYINRIVSGPLKNPTIKTAFKIARAMDLKVDDLWFEG